MGRKYQRGYGVARGVEKVRICSTQIDTFFDAKANFYKTVKEELAQNLEKKKALCEKVEKLKENTEWKKTADKLVQIQKEAKKTFRGSLETIYWCV
ncbi:MAG: hypothetical protein CR965_02050 [Paludibacter sp.]|nr:MAG: hypothetical protein CR965_02050 [Paludibacter sp.]